MSEQSTDTVQRILALRESHRRVINDNFGRAAGNGHRVLEHIFSRPVVSVDDVQELIGTTYQTANNLVARLVEYDILREFTGQARNRAFIYQRYLDLFHETGQEDEV
ncbi:MAG: helix-turn-helix domain-containing protein [Caldilineaceae bacterium]|nr:helix-turn-helix domain-containing protein [Caldilineaceae bacterium]